MMQRDDPLRPDDTSYGFRRSFIAFDLRSDYWTHYAGESFDTLVGNGCLDAVCYMASGSIFSHDIVGPVISVIERE